MLLYMTFLVSKCHAWAAHSLGTCTIPTAFQFSFVLLLFSGNVNCVHMVQFAEAELAALKGNVGTAMDLYNKCIKSTARNGCVNDRAIAHERAGLFALDRKKMELACCHLKAAAKVYRYWGAKGKVDQLVRKYSYLLGSVSTLSML